MANREMPPYAYAYDHGIGIQQLLGEPDMIVPSIPIDIPANGNDLWTKHYVESGLLQDRCIKAAQVKPRGDAAAVVHHANTYILVPDEDGQYQDYGYLTEYAMGKWGELMPEGVCRTGLVVS